jgi:predicted aminopeptidase
MSRDDMLAQKKEAFDRLRAGFPGLIPAEPNNAFLVSIALYNELVPAFERLLAESGSLDAFYARVKKLAASERSSRDPLLAQRR